MEIFKKIHVKFSENFDLSVGNQNSLLEEAQVKSRSIYQVGEQLKISSISPTKLEIIEIFNELFSDITVAIYLSTCSINHSSRIMMRRVLELGVSILYFWDMPHKYWGWKNISNYETDVSFKESTEYLCSQSYIMYLENDLGIKNWECDKEKINKAYRKLSNSIHGRLDTFATSTENSFNFDEKEYKKTLEYIVLIENILLSCFRQRFEKEFQQTVEIISAVKRYKYGY